MKDITVLLDAGHGIDTLGKGYKFADGTILKEWEFNRDICTKIMIKLTSLSIKWGATHKSYFDNTLTERAEIANTYDPNKTFLISVHSNADVKESNTKGFEVWTSPGCTKSDKMATIMYDEALDASLFKMRSDPSDGDPDKEAKFKILTATNCPAILTENGFYTNYNEVKLILNSDRCRQIIADYHVNAIVRIINECF